MKNSRIDNQYLTGQGYCFGHGIRTGFKPGFLFYFQPGIRPVSLFSYLTEARPGFRYFLDPVSGSDLVSLCYDILIIFCNLKLLFFCSDDDRYVHMFA